MEKFGRRRWAMHHAGTNPVWDGIFSTAGPQVQGQRRVTRREKDGVVGSRWTRGAFCARWWKVRMRPTCVSLSENEFLWSFFVRVQFYMRPISVLLVTSNVSITSENWIYKKKPLFLFFANYYYIFNVNDIISLPVCHWRHPCFHIHDAGVIGIGSFSWWIGPEQEREEPGC
jgi:hypothetical protein